VLHLLAERTDRRLHPLPWALPIPVRVHGRTSRTEILAAVGILRDDAPWIHRESVLWHEPSQTDLLFVTLNKSEALFSPPPATATWPSAHPGGVDAGDGVGGLRAVASLLE
jgi:hypothetical protein